MRTQSFTSATEAGKKNSLEPTTAPVVTNGADDLETQLAHILARVPAGTNGLDNLEAQLDRILARVPPIITLPKPKQKCPFTGQSRTSLLELVAPGERNGHKPPVRAIYRRSHKHAVRGRWLIPAENLFRYFLSLEADSVEAYLQLAAERKQGKAQ